MQPPSADSRSKALELSRAIAQHVSSVAAAAEALKVMCGGTHYNTFKKVLRCQALKFAHTGRGLGGFR